MFGRQATLPIDLCLLKKMEPKKETYSDEMMEDIMDKRLKVLESVKENILVAQGKYKQHYDNKHSKPSVFEIGFPCFFPIDLQPLSPIASYLPNRLLSPMPTTKPCASEIAKSLQQSKKRKLNFAPIREAKVQKINVINAKVCNSVSLYNFVHYIKLFN